MYFPAFKLKAGKYIPQNLCLNCWSVVGFVGGEMGWGGVAWGGVGWGGGAGLGFVMAAPALRRSDCVCTV